MNIKNLDFYRAIQDSNIYRIRKFRSEGVDINSDAYVFWGAKISVEVLSELLQFPDVDINRRCEGHGCTALMNAALSLKTDRLELLLQSGANTEIKDESGKTALLECASQGVVDSIVMLLDYGADIEARNKEGQNALMVTAEQSKTKSFKILLDRGAQLFDVSTDGYSVVTSLCWNANQEGMLLMCEKAQEKNQLTKLRENVEALNPSLKNEDFKSVINSFILQEALAKDLGKKTPIKAKKI